ncbi:Transcription factor EMB1444 [Vitis vinifera]|uniref:Transcription factor EMB1444 n=1 Tax=Vitis vinifera TaxID=29760 RepID=A0A438CMY1_VITVI|nr:Transcription factor EMB1444 [Vitis vinifera]
MATDLQQTLRSLCFNTEWKYAVLLETQTSGSHKMYGCYNVYTGERILQLDLACQMEGLLTWRMLTMTTMIKHDPLEDKCFSKTPDTLHDGHYSHDALGSLPVYTVLIGVIVQIQNNSSPGKTFCCSFHISPLLNRIVGQVAVTGKHQWIFSDKHTTNSSSSFEYCDGWQAQFSAGIKTIVVVAVVPHGVVQLGSLQQVVEDLKLVSRIKDVFFALQDSSVAYIPHPIQCSMKSSLAMVPHLSLSLYDISTRGSASDIVPDSLFNLDKGIHKERPNLPAIHQNRAVNMFNKDGGLELSSSQSDESTKFLQPRSENFVLEGQKQVQMKLISNTKREEASGWRDADVSSEHNDASYPYNSFVENINSCSTALAADKSQVDFACFPFGFFDSVDCIELSFMVSIVMKMGFSAGSELHEALGPAFLKQSNYCDWETEKAETETTIELPEGMSSSQLTSDSGSENLLEAVVAKVCQSGSDVKSEKSFCQSMQSLLTTEKIPEPSSHTIHTLLQQGISSICPSSCSEQLERSAEPSKVNKKRARPGESCRPRPRDRQLIQDRIKELRELVPNGSKCSIDSLLERTIKHMLFLQSITKHADKLNKCAESKLHSKETGVLGSSNYEQGSSWAVEVGSHMKVCPIIVENLNMDGQMVVEMVCEECSRFLEIAEAIRSLGLTILKGVTEARGEKTWICFVVELLLVVMCKLFQGQNSRNMRRMDILWSLVQILQPKPTM